MKYEIPPSSRRQRIKGQAKLPDDAESRQYIIDQIMTNAYPSEPFAMSLSRLASAVAYMGYDTITPGAAWSAYRILGEILSNEYKHKKKQ